MKFSEIELSKSSATNFLPRHLTPFAETIVIALIENFEFSPAPGHEDIKWRLSLVQTPALPGREHIDEPELPLKVTMVKYSNPAESELLAFNSA